MTRGATCKGERLANTKGESVVRGEGVPSNILGARVDHGAACGTQAEPPTCTTAAAQLVIPRSRGSGDGYFHTF